MRECTRDMDGVTWNAYLTVSNRARSFCHLLESRVFRTEAGSTGRHERCVAVAYSTMCKERLINGLLHSGREQLETLEHVAEQTVQVIEQVRRADVIVRPCAPETLRLHRVRQDCSSSTCSTSITALWRISRCQAR
jgi:hypothetical protein